MKQLTFTQTAPLNQDADDPALLDWAANEGRVIVTIASNNRFSSLPAGDSAVNTFASPTKSGPRSTSALPLGRPQSDQPRLNYESLQKRDRRFDQCH